MPKNRFLPLTTLFVLFIGVISAAQSTGSDRIWSVGNEDNRTDEFFLSPDNFRKYDVDSAFLVGSSEPSEDWSYVHPGPADAWAGSRAHAFTVYFKLEHSPAGNKTQLSIDCAAVHPNRPPRLKISVNGHTLRTTQLSSGTFGKTMQGDPSPENEQRITIDVPAKTLTEGVNQIQIKNVEGSWFLYDAVTLRGASERQTEALPNPIITSVNVGKRIITEGGQSTQNATWTVVKQGKPESYQLKIGNTSITKELSGGRQTVKTALPASDKQRRTTARIVQNGKTIHSVPVTVPVGKRMKPVDWVDPMIGTSSSRWMLYPGPSMPFGMVKLSPDNQKQGWKAGYDYSIENVAGFSHLHSWTMGGLLTMPTTGPLQVRPGTEDQPEKGYRSRISHGRETASPGYYSVFLEDYGIRAELTTTTRAGFQRYTFPESDHARILFDLNFPTEYGFKVHEAQVRKVSNREIEGYVKQQSRTIRRGVDNDYTVHFVARLDQPFDRLGGWKGTNVQRDLDAFSGKGDVGVFLGFSTSPDQVIRLQTGISLVSVEQARLNLETEMKPFGWSFDEARKNARRTWNELLSKIEVSGGTRRDRKKFYTNLYRSYTARTIWSDVNGKYVDMHEKVRQLEDPESPVYGADAFWNTFWNLNQLWTLVNPDVAQSWVRSLLEIYDRGGWLPKGPTGIEYSSVMVASHEIPLMVSAYQKGLRDYDVQKMFKAIHHQQTEPGGPYEGGGYVGNLHLSDYLEHGYVPVETDCPHFPGGPVSNTLEYAFDDWCVAQLAQAMGKNKVRKQFMERARYYRNVFDTSTGYVRPRHEDGTWYRDFDPNREFGFVEGNAWQYTFFVPHDVKGLINLMGRKQFNNRLQLGFIRARSNRFSVPRNELGVNHGNQPNMQAAYLFNYSGRPWLTQKWARAIMERYYGTGPKNGWPGDEDQGQMGAWFAMSAMGLFEMNGGAAVTPIYEIGSPLFKRIKIHLDDAYPGETFEIIARNNSKENIYIQSAKLDGESLEKPWFKHEDLVDGGELILEMGPEPNRKWGSDPADAPPSMTE